MACIEWRCNEPDCDWWTFENREYVVCPKCGSFRLSETFDEQPEHRDLDDESPDQEPNTEEEA